MRLCAFRMYGYEYIGVSVCLSTSVLVFVIMCFLIMSARQMGQEPAISNRVINFNSSGVTLTSSVSEGSMCSVHSLSWISEF